MASATHFFEGTEKLLEVWFSPSSDSRDLRIISRQEWAELLKNVRVEIISYQKDADMDAYVLSESSMFVTKRRFILKTCGTTTLLLAVKPLLKLIKDRCNIDSVDDVFYSRKKFRQPEKQHEIHQRFEDEVSHLDELFNNGVAYTLGRINKDCWYLYTLDDEKISEPDQTFELLMWNMDQEKMKIFTKEASSNGSEASQKCGIDKLLPNMLIDDYLFEPCGYSMNGILPGGYYITIHVTPEPQCSYVSFETNVSQESYFELLNKLLDLFKPGNFLLTVFANKASNARNAYKDLQDEPLPGYMRLDHQFCMFKNYNLTYTYYASRPII
ncbi:S-adenosylmethionine decarboxylase proenzyme 1 isoform X1 [Octopus sinensis]|uniref:adenosylmethionine decarboxylase n=1 Tax=Octopus sinensis TaxID=2607531 RepID=A0A6P7SNU0_9MOLL|nr:S-adenosylmethionine decarboxylase proenzyme 1 isoform X1 [Octopus sinensis]